MCLAAGDGGGGTEPLLTAVKNSQRTAVCIWMWAKKEEQLLVAGADRK